MASLNALDCITSATGISIDYILYGKGEKNRQKIKDTLHDMIEKAIKRNYKCITNVSLQ